MQGTEGCGAQHRPNEQWLPSRSGGLHPYRFGRRRRDSAIANMTAARLALKTERRMRVFSPDAYVSLDYQKKYGLVARRGKNVDAIRQAAQKIRSGEITDLSELNYADLVQVEELEIAPAINTGILYASEGVGQVGAGVARAPLDCFKQALLALDEFYH